MPEFYTNERSWVDKIKDRVGLSMSSANQCTPETPAPENEQFRPRFSLTTKTTETVIGLK